MAEIRKLSVKYGKPWEVRYSFNRNGQRFYRRPRFATREQAKAFAATVESDAATGYVNDYSRGKETFVAYAERWLRIKEQSPKAKPATVARYRALLERHAFPAFGTRPVRSITVADINDFVAALSSDDRATVTATDSTGRARSRRAKLSPASVRHVVNPVRQVLALAVREGALRHNVATDAELPTARRTFAPCFLSPGQVDALASTIANQQSALSAPDAADSKVYSLVVLVLAYSGWRAGRAYGRLSQAAAVGGRPDAHQDQGWVPRRHSQERKEPHRPHPAVARGGVGRLPRPHPPIPHRRRAAVPRPYAARRVAPGFRRSPAPDLAAGLGDAVGPGCVLPIRVPARARRRGYLGDPPAPRPPALLHQYLRIDGYPGLPGRRLRRPHRSRLHLARLHPPVQRRRLRGHGPAGSTSTWESGRVGTRGAPPQHGELVPGRPFLDCCVPICVGRWPNSHWCKYSLGSVSRSGEGRRRV